LVEADPDSVVTDHFLLIMVDGDDSGTAEPDTFVTRGEEAQGVRDVAGVETASRHLVEQRLKRVVREPVDQCNPEPLLGQLICRRYSSEAGADNHHMRHLSHKLI
jgi:hypothetical protein